MDKYIKLIWESPFHLKLLVAAVLAAGAAAGARWDDTTIPEGTEYLFIAMAVVCVIGAIFVYRGDRKIAANAAREEREAETERQRLDAELRAQVSRNGGNADETMVKSKLNQGPTPE